MVQKITKRFNMLLNGYKCSKESKYNFVTIYFCLILDIFLFLRPTGSIEGPKGLIEASLKPMVGCLASVVQRGRRSRSIMTWQRQLGCGIANFYTF